VNSTGPVFGPRPLGSGPAQRPFRLGQPKPGGGGVPTGRHRASAVARLTDDTPGGEVGGEASPRRGLCARQVHGGGGSPKCWVDKGGDGGGRRQRSG
jgi:hypothetical protein